MKVLVKERSTEEGLDARAGWSVGVWSLIAATVLTTFYLVTSIYIASRSLLWFDEIFTVLIARLPHWTTIWTALAHAVDSQPPSYYVLVRVFDKLLGHSEMAVRLPSALALAAGMLITFDCARRLADGLHGLVAVSVLTCSFLPFYGYEARPYAIYFMLAAMALWVWTNTRNDSSLSAIVFGAVFFLGVTIHYYFFLCLVPYMLWEISRWRPWRPPSPKLVAGIIGVTVPAALLSSLILSYARLFSVGFAGGNPSFWFLGQTFPDLFPNGLLLLALVMVWIALVNANDESVVLPPMRPGEAVGWLSLCIPLAGFVVAELKTNAFASRYFVGALPGIAVAFSCWLWRHFGSTARVSVGVFLLLATFGVYKQAMAVRDPESVGYNGKQKLTRQYMSLEDSLRKEGKRFRLFSDAGPRHLESEYYSKHPEECIQLLWSDAPLQAPPAPEIHSVETHLAWYYPLHFWTLDDLEKHARETALIQPTPEVLDAMRRAGFQVQVRYSKPLEVVYLQ
jgi:Dolichyl-phosphate-mannose-protein mannosyltransferase